MSSILVLNTYFLTLILIKYGVFTESTGIPHGVHETLFEESPWSPQVHVDSTGTPHGLSMESMWTIGNAECSPHGVLMESVGMCGGV